METITLGDRLKRAPAVEVADERVDEKGALRGPKRTTTQPVSRGSSFTFSAFIVSNARKNCRSILAHLQLLWDRARNVRQSTIRRPELTGEDYLLHQQLHLWRERPPVLQDLIARTAGDC